MTGYALATINTLCTFKQNQGLLPNRFLDAYCNLPCCAMSLQNPKGLLLHHKLVLHIFSLQGQLYAGSVTSHMALQPR